MYGSATLAMLVTSTSIKAAMATTTAMSQGLTSGRRVVQARQATIPFPNLDQPCSVLFIDREDLVYHSQPLTRAVGNV